MPRKSWSNSKKRWIAEGLSRDGILTQPYSRFPFGRVKNINEFIAYYESGESEGGEKFEAGQGRALDTMVRRMLRDDFAKYAKEIPDAVRFTDGTPNDGSFLVRWVYDKWNFYPDAEGDVEEMDVDEEEDDDVLAPAEAEQELNENAIQPEEPNQEERKVEEDNGQGAEEVGQEENPPPFHIPPPSEEYARQVNEYHEWIQYREE